MTTSLTIAVVSAALGACAVVASARQRDVTLTTAAVVVSMLCLWVAGVARGWW
jgi:hypothetical protein